jgi:glycerophosphoryl diester phosphodiesterase
MSGTAPSRTYPAAALALIWLTACAVGPTAGRPQARGTVGPGGNGFVVIAHRGASGYLPEHTLAGAAMAHAMGADFIEQDVVLTADGVPIVLHDLYLDAVTDVASRFPGRSRADGRHYALDFTLEEVRSLRINERLGDNGRPVFPGRYPAGPTALRIPTLQEEIELIQGLNRSTGRDVGIYVEPKSPEWHEREGWDLVGIVLESLASAGYSKRSDRAIVQSFDPDALRRARHQLGSDLRLVQLIGENSWRESSADFNYLRTPQGLREITDFADGIGPWLPQVVTFRNDGSADISDLVGHAHENGLFVHAYTLRADQLPRAASGMAGAVALLTGPARLDGVFTDHPDQVLRLLAREPSP